MVVMLRFANPEFLWFAPLAVVLAWWWARRRRPALRYSDARLLAGLPGGRAWRAKWGGAALRGLAALALVAACAGPRRPDLQTRLPAEGIAIVLALDVSGSMATADAPWTAGSPPLPRLEAAKRAFKLFVAGGDAPDGTHFDPRSADQIGLVTFAALPQTACPLTLNHTVLVRVADAQEPKAGLDAGTNVGDAIAEGIIRLEGAHHRRKALILLSDGEHNVSREGKEGPEAPLKPRQAAQLAANLGIKVYTIDAGGPPPPTATPDEAAQREAGRQALRDVVSLTGGQSFAASSGPELLAAYKEIDALEKTEAVSYQYRRYFEYYPWCAAAALALLLAAHLLDRTRWRTVP
jgi:Ca-activated chloride channel family protein